MWGELATKNKLPLERALNGCEEEKFVRIVVKKVEAGGLPGEVRKLEFTPQTTLEIEKAASPLLIKPQLDTIITDFSILACKARVGSGRVLGGRVTSFCNPRAWRGVSIGGKNFLRPINDCSRHRVRKQIPLAVL